MTPEEYCQRKAQASGSSFYTSFFFLPPMRRRAITALYAYCREVDDVVDESTDPNEAARQLGEWRGEIEDLYAGAPKHPVTRALLPFLSEFHLPKARFLEIIDGMEMDLRQARYPDFDALVLYCYRVAGAVGLLAAEIFGRSEEATWDYAHALGTALQLTNIVRDVGEDAARGRIYFPLDELERFGVSEDDILALRDSEGFRRLMAFQIARAESFYAEAARALPDADRKAQRPGLVMAAIYRAVLDEIKRDPAQVLTRRVSLSTWKKLRTAVLAWIRG
ncbi:MAG: presqualene diphosphate synthase HpnD [Candidatus Accumulibacter sp.]|jgi:phytoene synthase|nr:presqualene diphosphate synthase HpnD [Accumulibacter sp.]